MDGGTTGGAEPPRYGDIESSRGDGGKRTFAADRAASLRVMFPASARPSGPSTTPAAAAFGGPQIAPTEPTPEPTTDVTTADPIRRKRRLRLALAGLGCLLVVALAGSFALAGSGGEPTGGESTPGSNHPDGVVQAQPFDASASPATDGPGTSGQVTPSPSTAPPTGATGSPTGTTPTKSPTAGPGATSAAAVDGGGRRNPSGANLALNRPPDTSSVEGPAWPAAAAFDGDPESRWGSGFSDPQWISVDLGEVWQVTTVRLVWERAHAIRYRVEVSTNGTDWTTAFTTTNGAEGVINIPAGPVDARYVRVYGTERSNGYGYSLYEFEVR